MKKKKMLVCSPQWPILQTLDIFCRDLYYKCSGESLDIISTQCESDVINMLRANNPSLFIWDGELHANISLLIEVRRSYPNMPILVIQPYFLFSDKVIAKFMGQVGLLDYIGVMSDSFHDVFLMLRHNVFFLNSSSSLQFFLGVPNINEFLTLTEDAIISSLNHYLINEMYTMGMPAKVIDVVMKWLVHGVPIRKCAKRIGLSEKTIYHYRQIIIRSLGIHNVPRNFRRSLLIRSNRMSTAFSCSI